MGFFNWIIFSLIPALLLIYLSIFIHELAHIHFLKKHKIKIFKVKIKPIGASIIIDEEKLKKSPLNIQKNVSLSGIKTDLFFILIISGIVFILNLLNYTTPNFFPLFVILKTGQIIDDLFSKKGDLTKLIKKLEW